MVTISWCKKQKRGIKVVEPNEMLSKEYMQTAEESLDTLKMIKSGSRVWLATTKYYCEYYAFYALLMRLGIKCEIHECTLELSKVLEKEGLLPKGYTLMLAKDKQLRIDNQYYLKNKEVFIDYDKISQYLVAIKNIVLTIDLEKINLIRERVKAV